MLTRHQQDNLQDKIDESIAYCISFQGQCYELIESAKHYAAIDDNLSVLEKLEELSNLIQNQPIWYMPN